jgi:hypothetical protein
MTSSYDIIYEALLPKLAECNLAESAVHFNFTPNCSVFFCTKNQEADHFNTNLTKY